MTVRPAAVAGSFYPRSPVELAGTVDRMLDAVAPPTAAAPKALVVPHAGYRYSGPIAASAYAQWRSVKPPVRVLLLGPAHHVGISGLALPDADALETPLGRVTIDAEAVAALGDRVHRSARVHLKEHSLEVQLPFLQQLWGSAFTLVPLAVGYALPDEIAAVIDTLWDQSRILISTDLSHYLDYDAARARDRQTADAILSLDPAAIDDDGACGCVGLRGFLTVAKRRGLSARLLDLRSSGDTEGDRDRVVGYGAFSFTEAS